MRNDIKLECKRFSEPAFRGFVRPDPVVLPHNLQEKNRRGKVDFSTKLLIKMLHFLRAFSPRISCIRSAARLANQKAMSVADEKQELLVTQCNGAFRAQACFSSLLSLLLGVKLKLHNEWYNLREGGLATAFNSPSVTSLFHSLWPQPWRWRFQWRAKP